ncbi:hypothetical protein GCK72_014803 [Caenorhabditis remanei]|uniref:Sdz-33 F-box domain-containing protein n=1 Tax=Caenorhabditis remanei TaxID=31234 RepID=A0A6A5GV25_CAERE|nr:hypothetical protein GCK72_014803 [Caenorhabditis remanei]KAF1758345.1 hypothetical protein GCK72_014803 [Caenorhabditis remanei]
MSNVLRNFDYLEIIDFSLASNKCQFVIQSMKFQTFGIYKYLKRNTALTQHKTERNTICIEFTKEWTDYICALFRKDLSCLAMNSNSSTHEILSITDWINKKQWTLEYYVDAFFVKNRSSKYPVNWLTVDDIMISLCRIIMIETCSFDENDINRILKGWLNGNNSQLESFTVVLKMLNFQLVLDGIDFERKDETLKREFEYEFAGRQCNTLQFTGGFDIRRKDGTLATVQQRYHFPSNAPIFWFVMVVWPNN